MARKASEQPTDVELAILRVLWGRGPSSVREVHEALLATRDTGYSTTLKMMQVMFEKGLLVRDESRRPRVRLPTTYCARAAAPRAATCEHVSPCETNRPALIASVPPLV